LGSISKSKPPGTRCGEAEFRRYEAAPKNNGITQGVSRIALAAPLEAGICIYSAGSGVPNHTVESLIEKILRIQVTSHCAYLFPGEDT
jgi:hypothetical protein